MVAVLAVFFQRTRIGRALRAVADGHQAALSVGISLEQIWVDRVVRRRRRRARDRHHVGRALGGVVLAADHRAEGAAGADPRRPHLHPGAIVGGLIIGIGEKLGEFYWGPLLGGGIESWLLMSSRSASCCSARRVCSAKNIIERI